MVFGFNTDVKHGDTIYHVQSEARLGEFLLQTQVFVRGRCIGKRATSYADRANNITEEALHEELKSQHRGIVDAVREGRVDQVLAAPTASGIHPAGAGNGSGSGLDVEWTNADAAYTEGSVVMRFKVTQGGL